MEARYVFRGRFHIRVQRGKQRVLLEGWIRDLGEAGLGGYVAEELRLGEAVTLAIPLLSSRLTIPSKVTRCMGTEYGFQFVALSQDQRNQIRQAIAGCQEIPYYEVQ
jgi:hypothetical protein